MTDQEKYQNFIDYVNNPIIKFTDSEHMMPMIREFITPEEAAFLTGFPLGGKTLEEIAEIKQMDMEEVTKEVKRLCAKGIIYESIRESGRRYKMWSTIEIFSRIPYWNGKDEEPNKSTAAHFNKYWADGFIDQVKSMKHTELRSIPIQQTVEMPTGFMPFEDIVQVIDNYDYYTVSACPCRARHRLDPDFEDSKYPEEVCLHFNELGRYCVENGHGREITKEETLEILKRSAEAGLVHGIANAEEDPETICNCDLEYCNYFRRYYHLDFDRSIEPSNYKVKVTEEACKACGLCVKRCPMDALQLKVSAKATNKFRKAVALEEKFCIGCGVCVYKCKSGAIILERKPEAEITRSPRTEKELIRENVMSAFAALEQQKEKN
ncbi:MAG: 4Fe-4S binding protein [Deltaproteobacteria bacterium]|jgi:NAD-dependent dihydropyrimidine dehydrogenase PreA subunit|nr:4Fe-4S binding protein [Deltaproteobacteria bacterium]MBT4641571.1 4Fe-4S binding protein [Deltaproteobacteria bacterium]MBT6499371.1 4Fe-4S binding protein [Deltaproteobacteria bacterium]MBT6610637.1 4Fe-4S binding protein [Deltaproteobacteria bacterium]MBT7710255.1 4Fe-4S binding protein [Deltaproteobacteria bacterium]